MTEIEDAYPLSPVQLGMLLHSVYEDPSTYISQTVLAASGELRLDLLEQAWQAVLIRHATLRSVFVWADLDEPIQVVLRNPRSSFSVVDGADGPTQEFLAADRGRGFDLSTGPLLRLTVFTSSPWRLLVTSHHLVLDGWSNTIWLDELARAYEALLRGEAQGFAPVRPYRDYVAWLAEQDTAPAERFWRDALEGFETPTELGALSTGAAVVDDTDPPERMMSADATADVLSFARTRGLTLSTLVQGAFAVVLSWYTGKDDVCFGITSSGRPAELAGVESMVGMFLSTTPLRVTIDPREAVGSMLQRLQRFQATARRYEYSALTDIQSWSPLGAGVQLFDALLVMLDHPGSEQADRPLRLDEEWHRGESNFALTVNALVIDGQIHLLGLHDRGRVDDDLAARMLGHLDDLLRQMSAMPDAVIGELRPSGIGASLPAVLPPTDVRSLLSFVEEFSRSTPDAEAVVWDSHRLSYADLNAQADRFARLLRSRGARSGDVVAIALERSHRMVVSALGAFKAGCAYVPIDPFLPAEVIASIVDDSQARLVAVDRKHGGRFGEFPEERIVAVDDRDLISDDLAAASAVTAAPADRAVVMYVAGAADRSGRITLTHGAVAGSARTLAETMELGSGERVLDLDARLDLSIPALFASLTVGACLVIRSERHLDVLRAACVADRVSAIVTSDNHWVKLVAPGYTPATMPEGADELLRSVVITGDGAIPVALIEKWTRDMPDVALARSFGPIESGGTALVSDNGASEPSALVTVVGRPAPGRHVDVHDDNGNPLPVWLPGVLQVDGVSAPGVRVRRLPGGRIELLGRSGDRVDVAGFLIDCERVRSALLSDASVADCELLTVEEMPRRLVAYVTGRDIETARLRDRLRTLLPGQAVPSTFVVVDQIPRTASGRLLRSALPEAEGDTCPQPLIDGGPLSATEALLAEVWANCLALEAVGRDENFFELGGDSIALIKVIGEAARRGIRVTPRQVFENQTVAALAEVAGTVETVHDEPDTADRLAGGTVPLLPIQHWFFEQDLVDVNVWNTEFAYGVNADPGHVREAVEAVVRHHDAFRLRFRQGTDGWEQSLVPESDAEIFEYHDISSLPGAEQSVSMAATARAMNRALSLADGPTARFVHFHRSEGRSDLLFAVIHHAVFDGVSAGILRADLETALGQLSRGDEVTLQRTSTSYDRWGRELLAFAETAALDELDYWRTLTDVKSIPTSAGQAGGPAASESVLLTAEETRQLLKEVPRAFRASALEVLLAALVVAVRGWVDAPFLVSMEGHGREDLFPGVDLSRTIGWFATDHPVLLDPAWTADPAETVGRVREQVRAVPNAGVGYGVLRYLAMPDVRAEMQRLPAPQIAFGYLGQADVGERPARTAAADPLLASAPTETVVGGDDTGDSRYRSPSRRSDDNGMGVGIKVEGGVLHARFVYGPDVVQHARDHRLADRYLAALRELIAHVLRPATDIRPTHSHR